MKNIGYTMLITYIAYTYLVQELIHLLLKEELSSLFNGTDGSILVVNIIIVMILLIVIFLQKIFPKIPRKTLPYKLSKQLHLMTLALMILYLVSSITFYDNYSMSFRHTTRLRDAGLLIQLMFFLVAISKYYVFLMLLKVLKSRELSFINKANLATIFLASALSLNSSMGVLFLIIILFLFFKKSIFTRDITVKNLWFISFGILFSFLAILFVGHANKIGVDSALELFMSKDQYLNTMIHLAKRISTSYMSLQNLVTNHLFDFDLKVDAIASSYSSFIRKLAIVFPSWFDSSTSSIESVNRINVLVLYKSYNDHSGASPGLIASIFYIPFVPLGFLIISSYIVMIIRSVNRYTSDIAVIRILPFLIISYFCLSLYESPLSMLEVINPLFLYFLLFYFGSFFKEKK